MYFEIFIFAITMVLYKLVDYYLYWRLKGVDLVGTPVPLLGHICDHVFLRKSYYQCVHKWYLKFKGNYRYIGIYCGWKPYLLIVDPILAKEISIDHFEKFSDRGYTNLTDLDARSENLITVKLPQWKAVRDKIHSGMNINACKQILPLWEQSCYKLNETLLKDFQNGRASPIDLRLKEHLLEIFVTSCMGITYESFIQNDRLRGIMEEILHPTFGQSIRTILTFACPSFLKLIKWRRLTLEDNAYMKAFFKEVLKAKKSHPEGSQKDFLINLELAHDNDEVRSTYRDWEEVFISNCLTLLIAGFDSIHVNLSLLLFELARHQEAQEKLYHDICDSLSQHDGKFSYEAIMSIPYMDAVINENLRMYPPFPFTLRECSKKHNLTPEGPLLEPGDKIVIPIESYQKDPDVFEDPTTFKPERFYKTSLDKYKNWHIPFGKGPRNCIGYNFSRVQMRLVLSILVKHFKFNMGPKSPKSAQFKHHVFSRKTKDTVTLYVEPRNDQ